MQQLPLRTFVLVGVIIMLGILLAVHSRQSDSQTFMEAAGVTDNGNVILSTPSSLTSPTEVSPEAAQSPDDTDAAQLDPCTKHTTQQSSSTDSSVTHTSHTTVTCESSNGDSANNVSVSNNTTQTSSGGTATNNDSTHISVDIKN